MPDPSHPAYRPTLTDSQIAAYLCRINNNAGSSPSEGSSLLSSTKSQVAHSPLLALRNLQAAHLRTIPFDNLGIHYNREHRLSLDSDDLFDKLVTRKRGGYCMESTELFAMVLRTLGYELYTGGARVNEFFGEQGKEKWEDGFWEGWDHMFLFVTIEEETYVVDVGFGPRGPTCPIPLSTDSIVESAFNLHHRLIKVPLKANTSSRAPIPWTLQYRNTPESQAWHTQYTFYEIEFLPSDYKVMNHTTSTAPGGKFVELLIVATWKWDKTEGRFVGWTLLKGSKCFVTSHGETSEVERFANEEERVKGIEKWFGMRLTEEEMAGIKGWRTELK